MHSSQWSDLEQTSGVGADGLWTDAREAALEAQLNSAPAYNATASVRITIVTSQYLPSSTRTLDAVSRTTNGWDAAPVVFSVQNGVWYIICGIQDSGACTRDAI